MISIAPTKCDQLPPGGQLARRVTLLLVVHETSTRSGIVKPLQRSVDVHLVYLGSAAFIAPR